MALSSSSIRVAVLEGQGERVLMEGKFTHKVNTESSLWSLEPGKCVLVSVVQLPSPRPPPGAAGSRRVPDLVPQWGHVGSPTWMAGGSWARRFDVQRPGWVSEVCDKEWGPLPQLLAVEGASAAEVARPGLGPRWCHTGPPPRPWLVGPKYLTQRQVLG